MSMHSSLSVSSQGRRHRNVLTREERIAKLKDLGTWSEEKSIFALPKVRSIKQVTAKKKAAKKEAAVGEGGAAADAAAPGAPAAAAASAKGGAKAAPKGGAKK
jgi:small basic protein (TIGR04137 family)